MSQSPGPLDPNEKRFCVLGTRVSPTLELLLDREAAERGLSRSSLINIILSAHFQEPADSRLRCLHTHPIVEALRRAHEAAVEKLADLKLELHEAPAIQGPLSTAQDLIWNHEIGKKEVA